MTDRPTPDGYAVVTEDGAFVGIWRDRDIAEKVVNRGRHSKSERIELMCTTRSRDAARDLAQQAIASIGSFDRALQDHYLKKQAELRRLCGG